jgi:hypothetical protein
MLIMQQRLLITVSCLFLAAVIFFSCKKRVEASLPPANSEIALNDNSAKNFYVLSSAPGDTYKIPIGITTPLDKPVTVQLSYSSTNAVAGTHYTAPASITIPAGKVLDSLAIKGNFANIASGVSYSVTVKISGGDLPSVVGKDSVVVVLRRYCTVVPTALAGNYQTIETSAFGGTSSPYISTVSNVVPTSATTATATMTNIWDFNIVANVIFDWTDPSNFKVSLNPLTQQTWYNYQSTAATFITQASGTSNTFSSCENKITMNFKFYTAAGTFDIWRADMVHQ